MSLDPSIVGKRVRIIAVAYPEGAHLQHVGVEGEIFALDERRRLYYVDPGEPLPIRGCYPENLEFVQ